MMRTVHVRCSSSHLKPQTRINSIVLVVEKQCCILLGSFLQVKTIFPESRLVTEWTVVPWTGGLVECTGVLQVAERILRVCRDPPLVSLLFPPLLSKFYSIAFRKYRAHHPINIPGMKYQTSFSHTCFHEHVRVAYVGLDITHQMAE